MTAETELRLLRIYIENLVLCARSETEALP